MLERAGPADKFLRWAWPVVAVVVPLVLIVLATNLAPTFVGRIVTEGLIKLVAVVALYIFVGNSGALSLGHVAFMGIGAYASAWQTCCPALKPITMSGLPAFLQNNTFPNPWALLSASVAATVVALVVGSVFMRLERIAIAIATLASLFVFTVLYSNWTTMTLGTGSIVGLPRYVTPGFALGAAVAAIIIAYVYQTTKWGKMMRAAREDEIAARSIGINVYLQRLIAFTLSGFVAGAAGVLLGHFLGTINVATFSLNITFLVVAMLIVGGRNSLAGAVTGVVVVTVVVETIRRIESGITLFDQQISVWPGMSGIVLGLVMLLILRYRPDGLTKGREIPFPADWKIFARRTAAANNETA